MAEAKRVIGHMMCPECDHNEAEVKTDKNGHPYRYCPDCQAQYFTRGDDRKAKNLLAKMRPVTVTEEKPADPAPVDPAPADPAPKADAAPEPAPKAKKKGGGWTTLIGAAHG